MILLSGQPSRHAQRFVTIRWLKDHFQAESDRTYSAAEKARVQEIGVGRQSIAWRGGRGGYTCCAKDISVAERIVWMI